MWSTLDDLVLAEGHWLTDWRRGGSASLLMSCGCDDLRFSPADHPYRFGIETLAHDGAQLLFHGGGFACFSSLILRRLEDACSLVVLANVEGFDASVGTWAERLWPKAD